MKNHYKKLGHLLSLKSKFLLISLLTVAINVSAAPGAVTYSNLTTAYDGTSHTINVTATGGSIYYVDFFTDPVSSAGYIAGSNQVQAIPASTNAGTYTYYARRRNSTLASDTSARYTVVLKINPKVLSIGAPSIATRQYDGTTTAGTVTVGSLSGLVDSETLAVSAVSANYSSIDASTYTGNVISYTLSNGTNGGLAANYSLANGTANGIISPKVLSYPSIAIQDKVYDGTTAIGALSLGSLNGLVGSENFTTINVSSTSFPSANVGSQNSTISFTFSGGQNSAIESNYTFPSVILSGNIIAKALTIGTPSITKNYDGTTNAGTVTCGSLSGYISGESGLTVSGTATSYSNKNTANNFSVNVSYILSSGGNALAGNYSLANTNGATASITTKALSISAPSLADKTYNGTNAAGILTVGTVSGLVGTETLSSITGIAAAYSSKNVGTYTNVAITYTLSVGGTNGGLGQNYTLAPGTATGIITPKALSITAASLASKVYDGTATAASLTIGTLSGFVGSETVTASGAAADYSSANVGSYSGTTISYTLSDGTNAGLASNYSLANATATGVITTKALSVNAPSIASKTYDATATAGSVTVGDLSGFVGTETVTASGSAANYSSKNVDTYTNVSVSYTLANGTNGGLATNYSLANGSASGIVTAKSLTVSASGSNKTYDGSANATVTLSSNKISGDVVTLSNTSATFSDKNVGTAKTISVSSISISGTDAGNYSLSNTTATTTADITTATLTVTATGTNKTYNGNTDATVTLANDKIGADLITTAFTSASYATKNVGDGRTIIVSGISITGDDASNYTLASTSATTTANVYKVALTVTASGINKTYNGNTTATVSLQTTKVLADDLTPSYTTATFANKNAGIEKTVSVSGISISGNDAANYSLGNTIASTIADITTAGLTVSASASNKTYDGLTNATVSLSSNKISDDVVSLANSAATFSDKNVGTDKTVSVSGISISGTDAANYSLSNTTASTTASITRATLTVSASGRDKTYDGNTSASVNLHSNAIGDDDITPAYTAANFASKNSGEGIAISITGISFSGNDSANYHLGNTTTATAATINQYSLYVSASVTDKVYDGNTTATATINSNILDGDNVTFAFTSANFSSKDVTDGTLVEIDGISMNGPDAANYSLENTTDDEIAAITPATLTVTISALDKTYNGNSLATISLSSNKITTDNVDISYEATTFDNSNAGNGKTVTLSGISISGTDALDYTLSNTSATATASINKKAIPVSATGSSKIYDGTINANAVVSYHTSGFIGNPDVTFSGTATFIDKNVGDGKLVSISNITLSGTDAGNYSLSNNATSTSASITAKSIIATINPYTKVYDGTTNASITFNNPDVLSGDDVSLSASNVHYLDKLVHANGLVADFSVNKTGLDKDNYSVYVDLNGVSHNMNNGSITARDLHVTAHGISKNYDGSTAATVTLSCDSISGDHVSLAYTSATFDNANTGNNKTVSVSGISFSGVDAGNYSLVNTTATTTATINTKTLTITASGSNKTYDGTTSATVTLSSNKVGGDNITLSYSSASFDTKNVGTEKTISVSGITISGPDAAKYTYNTTATATANVTARAITVTAQTNTKTYDGSTSSASNPQITSGALQTGDALGFIESYASKNVGSGTTLTASGIVNDGNDGANYSYTFIPAMGTINTRTLSIAGTTVTKVYDNTTAGGTVTPGTLSNLVEGETLNITGTAGVYSGKNALGSYTGIAVSYSLTNSETGIAANYTLASGTATGSITPIALTISAPSIASKVYNGSTAPGVLTIGTLSGLFNTQKISVTAVANNYASANVGTYTEVPVTYTLHDSINGGLATNYTLAAGTATGVVTKKALSISSPSIADKVYDGSTTAGTLTIGSLSGFVGSETVTAAGTAAAYSSANVGMYSGNTISYSLSDGTNGGLAANYSLASGSAIGTITKKALAITAPSIASKVYDATTNAASVTVGDLSGFIGEESVSATASAASYASANVGSYANTTVSYSLHDGSGLASNYSLASGSATATITTKALSITDPSIASKVYDGTATAGTLTVGTVSGFIGSETVTATGSAANYNAANVGTYEVAVTYTLHNGTNAGLAANYSLASGSASGTVTTKALSISAPSIASKVYNTTSTAGAVTVGTLSGLVSGESLSASAVAANYSSANVGTYSNVGVTYTLSNTETGLASNYTLADGSATGTITKKALTISAPSIASKAYDGTNTAGSVTPGTISGYEGGEHLTVSATAAAYSSANAGTYTDVAISYTLYDVAGLPPMFGPAMPPTFIPMMIFPGIPGTLASNYSLADGSATGIITGASLTVNATASDKTYDGTTTATVSLSTNKLDGDDITAAYTTANFSDKNAGEGKDVLVEGITISGANAANYVLANTTASTTATINQAPLTISADAYSKSYDGSTTTYNIDLYADNVNGDDINLYFDIANYNDKNVGTAKPITVSDLGFWGDDQNNYYLVSNTAYTSADILATSLEAFAWTDGKTYDGNTSIEVNLYDYGFDDDHSLQYTSANFDTKNVGDSKLVTATGISITGSDAPNYYLVSTEANTTSSIYQAELHISASASDKTYDATNVATVTLSSDKVNGDNVILANQIATFSDKNVGDGKTVFVNGISISGDDATNYSNNEFTSTTASITAKTLSVTASGIDKIYDGSTTGSVTLSDNRIDGDSFTPTYTTATFADKNAANGIAISVSGISLTGDDALNYSANATTTASASITAKALSITDPSITAKTYDGSAASANVTVGTLSGYVGSETLSATASGANYSSANVGSYPTTSVSYTLHNGTNGGLATNYSLANGSATAVVNKRVLSITGTTIADKTFNRTTTPGIVHPGILGNLVSGEALHVSGIADNYVDDNVSIYTNVNINYTLADSTGLANNYSLAATTADAHIVPAPLSYPSLAITARDYDATTAVGTIVRGSLSGLVNAESFSTINVTATPYSSADAGSHNTTLSFTFSGPIGNAATSNYSFPSVVVSGTVNPKALSITAPSIASKAYDGTVTAGTLTIGTVSGFIGTETVTATGSAADYSSANVGSYAGTNVSYSLQNGTHGGKAANYSLASGSATGVVTKKALTITAPSIASKVYDGSAIAGTVTVGTLSGIVSPETVSVTGTAADYTSKNVSSYPNTVISYSLADGSGLASNYSLVNGTATGTITAKSLTVSAVAFDKTYDASSTANITLSSDKLVSDNITLANTSATFNDKTVAHGKTVSVSGISISGDDATNYSLANTTTTATATINPTYITVTASASDKTYDGTNTATVTLNSNKYEMDVVTLANTAATFDTKNVGIEKAISVTGISISGTDAANYTLYSTTASTIASISAASLTVTASGQDKAYDGNNSATVTFSSNKVTNDDVTISNTLTTFDSKNVGTDKDIIADNISISGNDASNYTLANTFTHAIAAITPKSLTVRANADDKIYDATTIAIVSLSSNSIGDDAISLTNESATFDSKNVGTEKDITVTGISLSGEDAVNYTLANTTAMTAAAITPATISVWVTASDKVYDGTNTATATLNNNAIDGDNIFINYFGSQFMDKNVGEDKDVVAYGFQIMGDDAANYDLESDYAFTSASITPATLTFTFANVTKPFDNSDYSPFHGQFTSNAIEGDNLLLIPGWVTFDQRNVGTGIDAAIDGFEIYGDDANNYYAPDQQYFTTGDITPLPIAVFATMDDKSYDGSKSASVMLQSDDWYSYLEDVTFNYETAQYDTKNVGEDKVVTVSGISLSGIGATNYSLKNTDTTLSVAIFALPLDVTANGNDKTYDGTNSATVGISSNAINGDDVTFAYTSALFANKMIGQGKEIDVTEIRLLGSDASNYSLNNTTATTSAAITAASLTVSATVADKTYDANNTATVTLSSNKVEGDAIAISKTAATFDTKNVGTAKTVSVSGISIIGEDASNYSLANTTTTTTAAISKAPLAVTATASDKEYDGTNLAIATLSNNKLADDVITTAYTTATFDNKEVGTGKTVTVSGISIGGTDAGNYTANTSTTATASIGIRTLTITAQTETKTYDGTTTSTITPVLTSGVLEEGDVLAFTQSFATSNADSVITITPSGIVNDGNDGNNYTYNFVSTTGKIRPRSLSIAGTSVSKVFDNTTTAGLVTPGTVSNIVSPETLVITGTASSYGSGNKNAGAIYNGITVNYALANGTGLASNYRLASSTVSGTITPKPLSITAATIASKVYDGTTTPATLTIGTVSGFISGQSFDVAGTAANYSTANVGTTPVSISYALGGHPQGGAVVGNYSLANTTANATVTAKALTIASAAATSKQYDGSISAVLTGTLQGIVGLDNVTASLTGTFATNTVANAKSVTSTATLAGTASANYSLTQPTGLTANITAKVLTIANASVSNKGYDGTNTASVSGTLLGVIGSDNVTLSLSGTFNNKNVATAKAVTSTSTIAGSESANYTLTQPSGLTADITPKVITVASPMVSSKIYDGSTTATLSGSLTGVVGGDVATLSASGSFNNKNVGTVKAVTSTSTIIGTDAGNYSLTQPSGLSADITVKALTIAGTTIADKQYDGTQVAGTVIPGTLGGLVSGETLQVSGVSSDYIDDNISTYIDNSISYTLADGSGLASNYSLANGTASGKIVPKVLTFPSIAFADKVYDGTTTAATLTTGTVNGLVAGESFIITPSASAYSSKDAGVRTSTVSFTLTGPVSNATLDNYVCPSVVVNATILPKALSISAPSIASKVYDGTTNAAAVTVGTVSGFINTETVTATGTAAAYQAADVNTYNVAVSYTLANGTNGGLATNYSLASGSANATVTAKALTIAGTTATKVYDATLSAGTPSIGTLTGLVQAGDVTTTIASIANYTSKNVTGSSPQTVAVTYTLHSGNVSAVNYTLANGNALAAITPANLTITANNSTKYTGNATLFTGTEFTTSTLLSGDAVSSVTLTSAGAGSDAVANIYSITPSNAVGTGVSNYTIQYINGTLDVQESQATVTGGGSVNWSTWHPNSDIIIVQDGELIIDAPAVVNLADITIKSGGKLTLAPGVTLVVTGDFNIESDATRTGTFVDEGGTLSIGGSIHVQQYLTGAGGSTPNGRHWYVTSPLINGTSAAFNVADGNKLWYYNESAFAYSPITNNTTALSPFEGLVTRMGANSDADFVGNNSNTFNTGDLTIANLSRTGTSNAERGYHLIGNPYPSYIDWDNVTKTNVLPTIWYRTANNAGTMLFDTYNALSGVGTSLNGQEVTGFIPPMQAVWVRVSTDGTEGALQFNNADRSHQVDAAHNNLKADVIKDLVSLTVSNGTEADEAIVVFNQSASNSLDGYDSPKMFVENKSVPQIYTAASGENLVINGLSDIASNPSIAVGFKTNTAGMYTISLKDIKGLDGVHVTLNDALTGKSQDLTTNSTYSFVSDSTNNLNRFSLSLKSDLTYQSISKNEITIYTTQNSIVVKNSNAVNGTVDVIDLIGHVIATAALQGQTTIVDAPEVSGTYLVRVTTNSSTVTKRIIIIKE